MAFVPFIAYGRICSLGITYGWGSLLISLQKRLCFPLYLVIFNWLSISLALGTSDWLYISQFVILMP